MMRVLSVVGLVQGTMGMLAANSQQTVVLNAILVGVAVVLGLVTGLPRETGGRDVEDREDGIPSNTVIEMDTSVTENDREGVVVGSSVVSVSRRCSAMRRFVAETILAVCIGMAWMLKDARYAWAGLRHPILKKDREEMRKVARHRYIETLRHIHNAWDVVDAEYGQ